jgi:hypothetical protein
MMMGPAAIPPTPEEKKGLPTWAWILIGVGGAGVLGVGGYFAYKAGKGE